MTSLLYEKKNRAAMLTINRPNQRNAINYDVMDEFRHAIKTAEEDPSVSYIVITGSGDRAFCGGGDLASFHHLRTKEEAYPMLRKMGSVLEQVFFCKKPTVALLNGHAVGGGCELSVACDYRIARRGIKMGFIQGSIGITTGWGGTVYAMERMGSTKAMEMLMSGKRYTPEEAYPLGFLTYILQEDQWEEEAERVIRTLLPHSSTILQTYKKHWLDSLDQSMISERIEREILSCSELWESEEHHKAVEKFLNKR
ncbi:enoyl-CoA hydratase/isomerase family protein [Guptibacillus algicola]|uniref:enoyl-CoA hydratase/isomerase family protein n=1 Tax=Guptibacillus algicola TaxID=225844 RepID=UPI001CD40602|nr:enoyl-CoA hydratase/isomerase family protein [Alkalihalobacillus algicola]MCA0987964.1 enoyl-CoA hydratase/isomerase family protein [Alkalihalobacillus algicola]